MKVYIWNDSDVSLIISQKFHIRQIIKYKAENCYLITANDVVLISTFQKQSMHQSWIKTVIWELLIVVMIFYININELFKQKLFNSIIIYSLSNIFIQIKTVIAELLYLFENYNNVINVFKTEYINISLLNNWHNKYKSEQICVYSLRKNNQAQINKIFNKLHEQSCIKWINIFMSFLFSCFII